MIKYVPIVFAVLILLGFSFLFSGCYTLKQGALMLGYLGRSVPLNALVPPPPEGGTDEDAGELPDKAGENRRFVERVRDIRRFAMEQLGLRESANYTRYVELDRAYIAAVVSAAAKDSFTRYEWWFPVVGKVPYKGFFNVEDARKQRDKLLKRDLDVWVRQVDAFSTLGWFKDPLYSYMRDYSDYQLANLLIHELLHATVYLQGQSQFDEELAEFVGTEGARLYIEKKYGGASAQYREIFDSEEDSAVYVAFLRELIGELDGLYKSGLGREETLARKEEIIRLNKERFARDYGSRFKTEGYRNLVGRFADLPLNNAYLELYRLYFADNRFYRDLYERSGGDLPRFIAAAKRLKKGKEDPKRQLERALGF
ncbi:MAG: aminopeptidase [Treponema sp.]|jgi:predicted aminopeptidase|nr:aminopeptidase [Treponema sp.]